MRSPVLLPLTMAAFLLLAACHKNSTSPSTTIRTTTTAPTGPYLYIGGSNYTNALYWKISLSEPAAAPAPDTLSSNRSIAYLLSADSTIYMTADTGGYWRKDSFITVTGAGTIQYIAVSGNNVYTTGSDISGNLAYWAGNAEINLENSIGRSTFPYQGLSTFGVTGITSSGSNVWVSGVLSFENEPFTPDTALQGNFGLLWANGALQLYGRGVSLSINYPSTVGVAVSGSDVYVAGSLPDTTFGGGYWKDGVWNAINNGYFSPAAATNIAGNIYIPGYTFTRTSTTYTQKAAVWENGQLINLNGELAVAMTVSGSDTYVLGIDNNNNAVVWKNGAVFSTLGSADNLSITSMAIAN